MPKWSPANPLRCWIRCLETANPGNTWVSIRVKTRSWTIPISEHETEGGPDVAESRRTESWEVRGSKTRLCALVVEDSEDDALLVVRQLDQHGYETYYERVETPEA